MHDVAPHRLVGLTSGLRGPWQCVCGEDGTDAGYDHLDFYGALLHSRLSDDELVDLLRAGHTFASFPRADDHAAMALLDDGRWMPLLRSDAIVRWAPDGRPRATLRWSSLAECLLALATRGVPELTGAGPGDIDPGWTAEDGTFLHMILCVISYGDYDSWPISLRDVAGLPYARRLRLAELLEQTWLTRGNPDRQEIFVHHQHIIDAAEASLRFGAPVAFYTLREVSACLRLPFGQHLVATLSRPAQ